MSYLNSNLKAFHLKTADAFLRVDSSTYFLRCLFTWMLNKMEKTAFYVQNCTAIKYSIREDPFLKTFLWIHPYSHRSFIRANINLVENGDIQINSISKKNIEYAYSLNISLYGKKNVISYTVVCTLLFWKKNLIILVVETTSFSHADVMSFLLLCSFNAAKT